MPYKREHGITVFTRTSHYFILLLLPVLRGFFFSGGNLFVWLSGVWMDLLVVAVILLLGYIGWYFNLYTIHSRGLEWYRGIFRIQKTFIPFDSVTCVSIERPWYYRPFHAVKLRTDTAAGSGRSFDVTLILSSLEADRILKNVSVYKNVMIKSKDSRTYRSNLFFVGVLSLVSSNTLTGILFLSTFISQSGRIFGAEFERGMLGNLTKVSQIVILGIPPFAIALSLIVLGGWLIAFILNLIRYARFSISRKPQTLFLSTGVVINHRKYLLDIRQINAVESRQTIFTKIFHFYTIYIDSVGYGKGKNEKSVLIPAASRGTSLRVLFSLFPEIRFVKPTIRPPKKAFRFFLAIPLWELFFLAAIIFAFYKLLPAFAGLALFFGSMIAILCGLFLIIKILSFSYTAIGFDEGIYTLQYTRRFLFSRISFPVQKLSKVSVRQTPFQKVVGLCTLTFYTYSESQRKHVVPNLPYEECKAFLEGTINQPSESFFEAK